MNNLVGNIVFGPPSTVGRSSRETTEQYHDRLSKKPHITAATLRGRKGPSYQSRVAVWLEKCFGPRVLVDITERNHRFLEEALELVQSTGCTASEAHQLIDYVFNRPVGDPPQEVGGVKVCLAGLCTAAGIDMDEAGEAELTRVDTPAMIEKIHGKWLTKPKHSPLPGPSEPKTSVEIEVVPLEWYQEGETWRAHSAFDNYEVFPHGPHMPGRWTTGCEIGRDFLSREAAIAAVEASYREQALEACFLAERDVIIRSAT